MNEKTVMMLYVVSICKLLTEKCAMVNATGERTGIRFSDYEQTKRITNQEMFESTINVV